MKIDVIEIKGNIFIQVLYSVDQHDSIVQRDKGSCKLVGFENSLAVFKFFMCEQINRFIKTLCAGIVSTGALGKAASKSEKHAEQDCGYRSGLLRWQPVYFVDKYLCGR